MKSIFQFFERLFSLLDNKTNASYAVRWVILLLIAKERQRERQENSMRKVIRSLRPKSLIRLVPFYVSSHRCEYLPYL
uniref:Uncharacterized protein MANES_05G149100 n=1 Tax=Rhizophora mucronata TaxID=61149 RepID=A0A2P2M112_RHIMU